MSSIPQPPRYGRGPTAQRGGVTSPRPCTHRNTHLLLLQKIIPLIQLPFKIYPTLTVSKFLKLKLTKENKTKQKEQFTVFLFYNQFSVCNSLALGHEAGSA